MQNKPTYFIASVDAALLLATVLQQEGPLRVTDAADRVGVSMSTAHRLLGMLVYREFAEQLPDRRYGPGPHLRGADLQPSSVAMLREVASRHLHALVDRVGETANLMVLTGTAVRFVSTVECDRILRVGDRTGRTMPAHLSSGGKAILAVAPEDVVAGVLAGLDGRTAARLQRELRTVRRTGSAVNDQDTEVGLTALGVAVPVDADVPPAAISVSMPRARWSRDRIPEWDEALRTAAAAIARDVRGALTAG